jgi:transposase
MANHYYATPDRRQINVYTMCIDDFVSKDHLAHHVRELLSSLDLSSFEVQKYKNKSYREKSHSNPKSEGGHPNYPNLEKISMICYSCMIGKYSTRVMEEGCVNDFAYRYLMSDFRPDHSTIARFISDYLDEFGQLFYQIVTLLIRKGYASTNIVAIDGSVIYSASSKGSHVSLEQCEKRMVKIPEKLKELIEKQFELDGEEHEKISRKISSLEQEERELEELKPILKEANAAELKKTHKKKSEVKGPYLSRKDVSSRLIKDKNGGCINGKNVQIAVEEKNQFILESGVYSAGCDNSISAQFLEKVANSLGQETVKGMKVLEDSGYFSENNLAKGELLELDMYVSPVSSSSLEVFAKEETLPPKTKGKGKMLVTAMKQKMQKAENIELYKKRMKIVEPVFAQIKYNRGFLRFRRVGKASENEWKLMCLVHNMLRLIRVQAGSGQKLGRKKVKGGQINDNIDLFFSYILFLVVKVTLKN